MPTRPLGGRNKVHESVRQLHGRNGGGDWQLIFPFFQGTLTMRIRLPTAGRGGGMVDATDLKSVGLRAVRVRVPPPVLYLKKSSTNCTQAVGEPQHDIASQCFRAALRNIACRIIEAHIQILVEQIVDLKRDGRAFIHE